MYKAQFNGIGYQVCYSSRIRQYEQTQCIAMADNPLASGRKWSPEVIWKVI